MRSGLRRHEKRNAERQQRAAAEEHARQMQEAREQAAWDRHVVETTEDEMQEREAQTPHDPLAIFNSDLGRDIAGFIRFLFNFLCLVLALGSA